MKVLLILALLIPVLGKATSLMPPYSRSVQEINAVLADEKVQNALFPRNIFSVTRQYDQARKAMIYSIVADECAATVTVKYTALPNSGPGPSAKRTIKLLQVDCLPAK